MINVQTNYGSSQDKNEKMWISGWMLAKYEEMQLLPETDQEIAEWFYGFTMGTVEAVLYEHLDSRLECLLQDYQDVLLAIQRWRKQGCEFKHSRLLH